MKRMIKMMIYWARIELLIVVVILASMLLFSCNIQHTPSIPHTVNPSFYHWKQTFNLQESDKKNIQELGLKNLYVRFFDIIWQPPTGAIPTAIIDFESQFPDSLGLIPCIYIENKVFQQLKENKEIEDLAEKAAKKIQFLLQKSDRTDITEVQLDCDWSASTRQNYFHFLAEFRKHFDANVLLSATIRLHQIKYAEKTGVPPVDKGMLMYYNMGKIKEANNHNSILDNQIGRQYISSKTRYDLPLDVALPIFEWGVWFHRGKFSGIFNDLNEVKLKEMGDFEELEKNVYMLEQDTVVGSRYLRRGDVVRLEGIEAEALKEAADICREVLNSENVNVAFYHWTSSLIEQQGVEFLKEIYQRFE
ncbi:MAG: hypothetical protein ACPGVB_08525 [Chitinophagales bacterium]